MVDQFEELFTLCQHEDDRLLFVRALHALSAEQRAGNAQSGSTAMVVLGVRADFYGRCLAYPELVETLRHGHGPVGPMSLAELREAVTRPAAATGLHIEHSLVEILLRDAGFAPHAEDSGAGAARPGVLPLLSHALLSTWQHRADNVLTVAGYQLTGGIAGAVAATAERVYTSLPVDQQVVARRVLLRLVHFGEDTETSGRAERRRLVAGSATPETTAAVLDVFAQARLLTLDADHVQLAHEVLLRAWPRLRDWLVRDRDSPRIHSQLSEAARTWENLDREPGALYRGTRLALAHEWSAATADSLSAQEQEFIDASTAAEEAERTAVRRRTRRLRQLVALLTAAFLVAAASTVLAVRAQRTSDQQRDIAVSQQVAAETTALRATSPALAAQLALAAYRIAPTAQTRSSLLSTFATPYATLLTGRIDVNAFAAVALGAHGHTMATASNDGTVRLWDVVLISRPTVSHCSGPAVSDATREACGDAGGRVVPRAAWPGLADRRRTGADRERPPAGGGLPRNSSLSRWRPRAAVR